jgi:16S rRNA (guanine(966)-N(2))-methyltransferase RsmD
MRVITGKYKGRHFDIPSNFKARPTTDFAKENLFNVLRGYVDFENCRVVDLFAGTGSISLEFLSRGCLDVVSVEKDSRHFAFIRSVMEILHPDHSRLLRMDALRFLERSTEQFDIVFADPPYSLNVLAELPERVMRGSVLKVDGIFVLEHGKDHDFSKDLDFLEHRAYGSVNFSFFRKSRERL